MSDQVKAVNAERLCQIYIQAKQEIDKKNELKAEKEFNSILSQCVHQAKKGKPGMKVRVSKSSIDLLIDKLNSLGYMVNSGEYEHSDNRKSYYLDIKWWGVRQ